MKKEIREKIEQFLIKENIAVEDTWVCQDLKRNVRTVDIKELLVSLLAEQGQGGEKWTDDDMRKCWKAGRNYQREFQTPEINYPDFDDFIKSLPQPAHPAQQEISFAIECLNEVRNKIVVEPEGNGFDDDVSAKSGERWRADGIINQHISKLKSQLTSRT